MSLPFGILDFGPSELILIGVIAVLLYGKNLPEAYRSIGKHLGALKRGMGDIQDQINSTTRELGLPTTTFRTPFSSVTSTLSNLTSAITSGTPSSSSSSSSSVSSDPLLDLEEPTAPKFEPPSLPK